MQDCIASGKVHVQLKYIDVICLHKYVGISEKRLSELLVMSVLNVILWIYTEPSLNSPLDQARLCLSC